MSRRCKLDGTAPDKPCPKKSSDRGQDQGVCHKPLSTCTTACTCMNSSHTSCKALSHTLPSGPFFPPFPCPVSVAPSCGGAAPFRLHPRSSWQRFIICICRLGGWFSTGKRWVHCSTQICTNWRAPSSQSPALQKPRLPGATDQTACQHSLSRIPGQLEPVLRTLRGWALSRPGGHEGSMSSFQPETSERHESDAVHQRSPETSLLTTSGPTPSAYDHGAA